MENNPIDFENGYKIRKVYANRTEEGGYGDICNHPEEVMLEHPGVEIVSGYCVIAEDTGLVPDGCNDWNNTMEEAIQDYEDHVLLGLQKAAVEDKKIKVVLLEPGELARTADIDASLEGLQQIVGGYIEAFYPFEEEVCIVCNEEGKLTGLPLNRAVRDDGPENRIIDIIAGPCFICDCSGEDFGSLTEEQLQWYEEKFKLPENFFMLGNEIVAIPYTPEPKNEKADLSSVVDKATAKAAEKANTSEINSDHER